MMTDNACMVQVQEISGLRADGGIMQYNFGMNCLSTYPTRQRVFHWRLFGQESCIVLFHIINLVKVYKSHIYRVYLLFNMNAK